MQTDPRQRAEGQIGTWGATVFEDDLALDVRDTAEAALDEGLDMAAVTARVMGEHSFAPSDIDEGPVLWLALASFQLEHIAMQPEVRNRALAINETGAGLRRWEDEGAETLAERQQVLTALKSQLEATASR